jgi:putative membrane protein
MLDKTKKYLLYFLVLVYFSGAIGFPFYPDFFSPFTPYTLLFTCLVFLFHQPISNKYFIAGFIAIAAIGFTSEAIGIKTGLLFGDYHYGSALGTKFFGVPFVISFNWALLVSCGILVSHYFLSSGILSALLSATIITAIDLLIEQICSALDFWYFSAGIAGLHNYIGWFFISFIASFLFQKYISKGNKKIAIIILALQIFFFGTLYLFKLLTFI